MIDIQTIAFVVLGACFGSFAGAVAWRLHEKKDFVQDRSECESCHHKLGAIDLIPIISWLMTRGKCRYCHHPITSLPILLELLTATIFALSFIYWPFGLQSLLEILLLVLWLIGIVCMMILFAYDLRWKLLPNVVMFPLIVVGIGIFVCQHIVQAIPITQWPIDALLGQLPVAGLYGVLYLISNRQWVGFGDVKLGMFMGLVLGWQQGLLALVLANLLGSIVVVGPMLTGTLKKNTHIPFGPFLIVATVVAFLWGNELIAAYLQSMNI